MRFRLTLPLVISTLFLAVLIVMIYHALSSPLALTSQEARKLINTGYFTQVVDVRTDTEWESGHLPQAIHIPTAKIPTLLPELIPDKKNSRILFYCNTSTRARMAAEKAKALGYKNVKYLLGTHYALL
jgi:rhodanese-related sulfurtransferase